MPLKTPRTGITGTTKFVDGATIWVKGGDGGRGCTSFGREKFVPKGKADGGDGGRGGDVLLASDSPPSSLLEFSFQQRYKAQDGEHGGKRKQFGRKGTNCVIKVPVGTLVWDVESKELIKDFTEEDQRLVVAKGGKGGKGNARFVSSTNRSPLRAEDGQEGEQRWLNLELKLPSDVGLIGYPNVGKSTLMARISSAKPKIADYPFTTINPTLGVAKYGEFSRLVVADLPALIEGAHRGAGLGLGFLRHIERTDLLIHLIDISEPRGSAPIKDFRSVNRELEAFSPGLLDKAQLVALNKIDLEQVQGGIPAVRGRFDEMGIRLFPISALTGEGVAELMEEAIHRVEERRERGLGEA
ncbi:MAG: GTPase ObgE [Deltaproteobacteria bacterium]|nr:GTPase ObgE [Deltaproteobacteria bacterium]